MRVPADMHSWRVADEGGQPRAERSVLASYTEEEFLSGGWQEVRDGIGAHWWSTMRLAGREALYRSAVHLAKGTVPTMRELLAALSIPAVSCGRRQTAPSRSGEAGRRRR